MKDFKLVQEHFRKLRCGVCQKNFEPDGVSLVREEKDYWVVRVRCLSCGHPAGVAIVGVERDESEKPSEAPPKKRTVTPRPISPNTFTSKKEEARFGAMKPITMDDVLDASKFIRGLDGDWAKYLPGK